MAATVFTLATVVAILCLATLTFGVPLDAGFLCSEDPVMMKVCRFCEYVYPNARTLRSQCCQGEPEITAWCKAIYVEPKGPNGYIPA